MVNATRSTLSDVLWRWRRGIARALLVAGALAGMTLGAPAHAQIAFRAASQATSSDGQPAPNFQAAGAAVTGTAAVTPTWPAHAIGDIALLFVESAGGEAATLTTAAGFVAVANSPQATGAGIAGTRLTVFWARATSTTMAAPTVGDPGNHVYARILTYRGVVAAGNPWDVTGGGVKAAASGTVTVTGVTTTMPNTLIVQAVSRDNDSAAAAFSAQTNANLTGITERSDAGTTSGNGGGFGVWDGDKALAGATGNTTANVTNSINAFLTVALRPPDSVLTINVPAGTVANDVMIASVTYRPCSNASGAACTTTNTPPAGWTLVNTVTDQTIGGGTGGYGNRLFVYQRVATGAEPANYTWTFGGQVVHAGAVGGIVSFSGVDTTTPVVAQAGALTAAATTHTAPSVALGGVAGAMLVTSHTANSSPTSWTAPAGMTSRVNASSYATLPDDLGVALQVNTLPNAPDPTVARTASWTSPPAADAGATHTLALRPVPPPPPAPGGFNAYETSTAAGAIIGIIKTKIAGSTISLDIIALNAAKTAILTTFTGTVRVEVLDASNNSGALDGNGCRPTWTVIQTLADPTFVAGDNGRKTISFTQANSYPNARMRIYFPVVSPTATGCSTDNFAIRPNGFVVSVTDATWSTAGITRTLNNSGAVGGVVHQAGQPFTITATAQNTSAVTTTNYNGSPVGVVNSVVQPAACGACALGIFNTGAWGAASGVITTSTASHSEVGVFNVQLQDQTFANVDNADGSTIAERYITSASFDMGRFVPDHFDVTPLVAPVFRTFNVTDAACSAGAAPRRTFTYIGQPFGYATAPQATITARNASGNTTINYRGALWKIGGAGATAKNCTTAPDTNTCVYTTTFGATGGTVTETYTYALVPIATPGWDNGAATPAAAGVASNNDGTGTITFAAGGLLAFQRSVVTPQAEFVATINNSVRATDNAEGVAQIITTTNPAAFNAIAFDATYTPLLQPNKFFYGRLRLQNANGSQLIAMPIPMQTQYWNGSGFVTNTLDNCTAIGNANVALGNYQQSLNIGDTVVVLPPVGPAPAFNAGVGALRLSAPGAANNGSVDVSVNLTGGPAGASCTTVPPMPASTGSGLTWLQGLWCTPPGNYTRDPTARATFGVYRNADRFIYQQENF